MEILHVKWFEEVALTLMVMCTLVGILSSTGHCMPTPSLAECPALVYGQAPPGSIFAKSLLWLILHTDQIIANILDTTKQYNMK